MTKPAFDPSQPFESVKPAFDPSAPFDSVDEARPATSAGQTFIESHGNAATLGYLPHIQAGVAKAMQPSGGKETIGGEEFDVQYLDHPSYVELRDENIARQELQAKENPKAAMLGTGTGILTTAAVPLGHAARGASLKAKVGRGTATGAGFGAVVNPGDAEGEVSPLQVKDRLGNAALGAGFGAVVPLAGVAIGSAGTGAKAAGRGAKKITKKMFSGMLGVSEEAVDDYIARHPELKDIVNVKAGIRSLQDDIERVTGPMGERLRSKKEALIGAKAANASRKLDLSGEIPLARSTFKEAQERVVAETAPKLSRAVERLREEVSKGSGRSFEILDEAGAVVKTSSIKGGLSRVIKTMEKEAVTDKQNQLVDLLKRYRERLNRFGAQMPASQAKRTIQALDEEIADAWGYRMRGKDAALAGVRQGIDRQLKTVPAYRSEMAKVAQDTRLLKKLRGLDTEQGAINALKNIDSLSKVEQRSLLMNLEKRFGAEFLNSVKKEGLPEYGKLKGLIQEYQTAKRASGVGILQKQVDEAAESFGSFKDLVPDQYGKSGVQSAIRSQLVPNANINTSRSIQALDERAGTQFSKKLNDLKTLKSFDGDFTRGSANTNFWGVMGAGIGSLFAGPVVGSLAGAAGGVAAGRILVDRYGPQTARTILDATVRLKSGMPAMKWIQSLRIPEAVKHGLEKEYIYYQLAKAEQSGFQPRRVAASEKEQNRKPSTLKGEAKWMQDGAQKLQIGEGFKKKLMQSKQGRQLLIEASSVSPDSKAMQKIKEKIEKGWGR